MLGCYIYTSSKHHDELQKAKASETIRLLELGEIKRGRGANQVGTLRRAGDIRWGSHFSSVCSLLEIFNPTLIVLRGIIDEGSYASQRGDADTTYNYLKSFEFVFILHLVKEIMGKTDILSQALQKKSQDIVNAIELVSTTKESLNDLRNKGWHSLLGKVTKFFEKHQIDTPDMKAPYKSSRYRPRQQDYQATIEHYYRVDIFIATLDKQLQELNNRFNDQARELLSLSSMLVQKNDSKVFDIEQIFLFVRKYYPADFTGQEMTQLEYQLELLTIEMKNNPKLSVVSTIAQLCRSIVETKKRENYFLLDRLIRLVLTLLVSTATTKRGFFAMKIFKNRLCNKMSDELLADNLVVYIEREIADKFDSKSVIDEFKTLKGR